MAHNDSEVLNKKKKEKLFIGIDRFGAKMYQNNNKQYSIQKYNWGDIKNLNFNDKKFTLQD